MGSTGISEGAGVAVGREVGIVISSAVSDGTATVGTLSIGFCVGDCVGFGVALLFVGAGFVGITSV